MSTFKDETHEFEINATATGMGSSIKIDGKEINNIRAFNLDTGVDWLTTLSLEIVIPGEVTGEGKIVYKYDFINDNEEAKKQLYEQLKEEFEN